MYQAIVFFRNKKSKYINLVEVHADCVRRVDDSRYVACHTTFRDLLRSSSMREPRYPSLGDFKLLHYLFLLFPTNIPYMSTWTVHSPNKNRNIIYILILSSNDKTIFASIS